MKNSRRFYLIVALMLSGSAPAVAADCDECHGPAGNSPYRDVPTIAGQDESYLARTLKGYRYWDRPCVKSSYRSGDTSRPPTNMCKIAEGLSDEDIQALAAHYAQQPFKPAQQAFDPALAEAGAALFAENCAKCHPQGGRAAGRGPRLAGQWMPYLRKTLGYVPTGEHMVPAAMERKITDFSSNEIDAILNFLASEQD